MDGLQLLISKLHNFQQQTASKFSEFEKILAAGTDQDDDKDLHGEIIALETKIASQLKVHKKADMDNKSQLRDLQKEVEHNKAKIKAKEKLISTLEEELRHLGMEQHSLTQGTKEETTAKHLEEEEARSAKQLGLEINKVKVGDCQPELSDMNSLVNKLNSTNNLSAFVHSIRKRFTSLVNK